MNVPMPLMTPPVMTTNLQGVLCCVRVHRCGGGKEREE